MRLPKYITGTLVILAATAILTFVTQLRRSTISPLPGDVNTKILGIFSVRKDPEALRKKVMDTIGDKWNNYSVYVSDLNSDFRMGINEQEIFTGASVNKLFILATIYTMAQGGAIDFDRSITLQTNDIQDYGTGSIRYDPPGSTYSVKTLVRLMMQKSDNTAAFLLANYIVGMGVMQAQVNSWGMSQTDMVNNKTSNADVARLMGQMYRGKITSPALTAEMLGFTRDSDFEDRLPANLPKDAVVYHKIGTGDTGEVHDVGIVAFGTRAYYVGVLTTGAGDPEIASELIADISKGIFDFMR